MNGFVELRPQMNDRKDQRYRAQVSPKGYGRQGHKEGDMHTGVGLSHCGTEPELQVPTAGWIDFSIGEFAVYSPNGERAGRFAV